MERSGFEKHAAEFAVERRILWKLRRKTPDLFHRPPILLFRRVASDREEANLRIMGFKFPGLQQVCFCRLELTKGDLNLCKSEQHLHVAWRQGVRLLQSGEGAAQISH